MAVNDSTLTKPTLASEGTVDTPALYDAKIDAVIQRVNDLCNETTTKGDLLAANSSGQLTRLAAGTNNYVLTADSTATLGVKWVSTSTVTGINVKDYSATGDGVTNDTTAVQNAITAAQTSGEDVFFPAGRYRCDTLTAAGVRLVGEGTYGYALYADYTNASPSYDGNVTIIENYTTLADSNNHVFTSSSSIDIENMVIRSRTAPYATHRSLFTAPPSGCTFRNVLFEGLTSLGSNNSSAWGNWNMSDCQVMANQGDVFYGVVVDLTLRGCRFTSTTGNVLSLQTGAGFNSIVGCRFEYTGDKHVYGYQSRENTFMGNVFDRAYKCGVFFTECYNQTVTGNVFWRNAYTNSGEDIAHIQVSGCTGETVIVGNVFKSGKQDDDSGAETPQHLLRLTSQNEPIIWRGNADSGGCTGVPFSDRYSTSLKCIDLDQIRVTTADANTVSDTLATVIQSLGAWAIGTPKAIIRENRKLNSYVTTDNVALYSIGSSASVIDASAGNFFGPRHNCTFDTITYTLRNGVQLASAKPSGYSEQGRFPVGTVLWDITPASGQPMGWMVTAAGSPDTLTNMANLA